MNENSFYRKKWQIIKQETSGAIEDLVRLSRQIAYSFMDYYLQNGHYEEDYIDLLCEMATFFPESQRNAPAARTLFAIIVESLCDDFEELQTETYNRVMAQVITYCRKIPSGEALDKFLKNFSLNSCQDILDRIYLVRHKQNVLAERKNVKKIILLSRVTIGADIAISTIIIERLSKSFPESEIVVLGDPKLEEILGDNPKVRICPIAYSRRGGLMERLSTWYVVLEAVQREVSSLSEGETIVVDTDSRLSQLGILPLVPLKDYYFFPSRTSDFGSSNVSMGKLTNEWLNVLLKKQENSYPAVWPMALKEGYIHNLCHKVRACGAKRIIAINFGVGGNPRKKLSKAFEEKLLASLLQEHDTVLFLDKGFGKEEVTYTESLLQSIENRGYPRKDIVLADKTNHDIKISAGIIGIESNIGEMAALIYECDEYIGYDSACQHIAAAIGTPCLTLFAGSNNMRFIRRWSSYGPKDCHIIHVDTLSDPTALDTEDILTRIQHVREKRA